MEDSSRYDVPSMAFILQSKSSSVSDRLTALRSLKVYLEENETMDAYSKKRIKQLILDNVLQMILSEDKVINVVKRQMVRTELFLILAKLLDSNILFGSIFGSQGKQSNEDDRLQLNKSEQSVHEPMSSQSSLSSLRTSSAPRPGHVPGSRILLPPGGWVKKKLAKNKALSYSSSESLLSVGTPHSESSLLQITNESRDGTPGSEYNSRKRMISNQNTTELNLLQPVLHKLARSQRKVSSLTSISSKTWKPRPSVLHNEMVADSFVPGADPMNYFEQDRKLGYQKPRMWFPGASMAAPTSLLPADRLAPKKPKQNGSEQVVQEYMQMRSLASYVGDLVTPFTPVGARASYMSTGSTSPTKPGSSPQKGTKPSRLSGHTDQERFTAALKEIAAVWSPLLGVHLPPREQQAKLPGTARSSMSTSRKRKLSSAGTATGSAASSSYSEYAQEIVPFKCLRVDTASSKGRPRPPPPPSGRVDMSVSRALHRVDEGNDDAQISTEDKLYLQRTQQYQSEVSSYLQTQREHILASIKASERLIAASLQSQYHLFKPKYLLLLEGNKANSRALVASAMVIFSRVKRTNLLNLAFGIWKILLVEMASVARRPQYSRVAACHLMARWQQEVHLKKLRIWIVRWRRRTGALIFIQRTNEVIRIQTLYRTWRDRRKFIQMHLTKTFQGVLSDIYLGSKRKGLVFFVPDIIRQDRRLLWLAATIIQTVFRCWVASKDFYYKRRMILLIQSIIRMFPRYQKYKRLKRVTIQCQAWARRTVKFIQYKRLKKATIIVQKYVRRYLGILLKLRIFSNIWYTNEQPLGAVLLIQCRYRIHIAKKRIKRKKYEIALRKYSALVIQRNYYRYKKAFHTFFLMCCLRERETLDLIEIKRKTAQNRYEAATIIQIHYKERYFRRNLGAIVKVQCWFRGRMGYSMVDILRKERWAGRKIRAWVKVRVRRRRNMAYRIQRWWWRCVEGRLRKHLWWRLMLSDRADDTARSERRHFAAMRIQAYVKGVWDRRWVRRHRAILIIQKNLKFYFGLKRWRRWKKEKIMKIVRKYALYVQERGLKHVLARILKKHSDNMRKPQALARGFIVRTIMRRAKWVAYRIGIAAVCIQRFWRKSGAMGRAVEEVMVLKRERSNPFVPCDSAHEVLVMMRRQTRAYYSTYDPRVGLRVSAFLYRLGCQELSDMFPRKNYVTVSDMSGLSLHRITDLYEAWRARLEKTGGNKQDKQGSVKLRKKPPPPTQLFETILSIVNPRLYSCDPKHREKIRTIMTLPEYVAPVQALDGFKRTFQRKFGKNLNARAEHMAKDLLQMIWGDFNNYKMVGSVLTKHHIIKAISTAPESSHPLQLLEEIRTRTSPVVDEKKWDKERVSKTAEILQLAVDRLLLLLPAGKLRAGVERANNRIVTYRRKAGFLRQRLQNPSAITAANSPDRRMSVVSNTSEPNKTPGKTTTTAAAVVAAGVTSSKVDSPGTLSAVVESRGALDLTSAETLTQVLPIARTLDLPFESTSVADLDLEVDVSICRVFFDVLDRLHMMTKAVQSLKNSWYNHTLQRAVTRAKALQLKTSLHQGYLQDREEDKVKRVWLKNKRMETSKKKLELIMKAVYARKAGFKFELSFVPKYGWICIEDDNGYSYWMDTKPRGAEESTYDMPVYSLQQYFMLLKLQCAARQYLERLLERKRLRELEALAEVARLEALMEEERRRGARVVKTRFRIFSRLIGEKDKERPVSQGRPQLQQRGRHQVSAVPALEELLPWKYRFYHQPVFRSGFWALLHVSSGHAHQNHEVEEVSPARSLVSQYEIVTVFRIRGDDEVCDVRNVKGKFTRGVSLNRLSIMHMDVGTQVETRYKQEQVFYRSKITHIDATSALTPLFSIRYEDGETAAGLSWDAIRPSMATLRAFLRGREQHLVAAKQRHRRLVHFDALRRERIHSFEQRVAAMREAQALNNPEYDASRPGSASSDSPMLALEDGTVSAKIDSISSKDLEMPGSSEEREAVIDEQEQDTEVQGTETESAEVGTEQSMALILAPETSSGKSVQEAQLALVPAPAALYRLDLRLRLPYSRTCSVFGWQTFEEYDTDGRRVTYYANPGTGEASEDQPTYSATEVQCARRIQLAWLVYTAHCRVYRRVLSLHLPTLITNTIKACSKIAFVGYELEGVTVLQMLRRAGYWELADVFESHYKSLKRSIHSLTLEEIARKHRDDYESLGVIQPNHQRELKEFQTWWVRSTTGEKQRRLALFNYFTSPEDERDIKQCIAASEELMVAKFIKHIKTGAARTRAAVQIVAADSHFPHAHQQVETYLKKYADKAELARDSVFELVNKHTTHTWVEERVVLRHYRVCCRLIRAVLGNLRLKVLRAQVVKAEKKADLIMQTVPTDTRRVLCTGPEAKAALLLRIHVLQYMLKVVNAVEVIQRNVRCYLLSKRWSIYLIARTRSIDILQRTGRKFIAMKLARALTAQRLSEWEQLWDGRRNLLYYYNHVTGISQYDEPNCPFRPLVRDPLSSALVQAWPELDNRNGALALLPTTQGSSSTAVTVAMQASHTHCGVCRTRKCVRICLECTDEVEWDPSKYHAYPYCFTCFMKEHPGDNAARANHQFTVMGGSSDATALDAATAVDTIVLRCSMCEEPATRKCLGMVDEETIDSICIQLKRTSPEGWLDVLKAANIVGDRKLLLLLDQIRSESNAEMSSLVTAPGTEAKKETAGSESRAHTPGRHKGSRSSPQKGRKTEEAAAPAQDTAVPNPPTTISKMLSAAHLQAVRTLLERSRAECDECYCTACYQEVHAGGKRALHRWKGFRPGAAVCSVCTNSAAELNCLDCEGKYCASCYKVFHSMGRKRNHKREKVLEELGEGEVYCGFCERRVADAHCDSPRCHACACDSCLAFKHKPQCRRDIAMFAGGGSPNRARAVSAEETETAAAEGAVVSPAKTALSNAADTDADACVVCGQEADQRCVQCGDCYCSRVWMGNPGCFAQHHSRGNRAAHTTEMYMSRRVLVASMQRSKSLRASRKALLATQETK